MADHTLSGAPETCPQELIDLILENTDSADTDTLKSCALVAHSFRPTSQKLIFSDLTILPLGRDTVPALQRLSDVLSASPHLALHFRTLHLVQPRSNETCVWMQSDVLPAILSLFINLESLDLQIYNWEYLHSQSASFRNVEDNHYESDPDNASVNLHHLRLASLHLDAGFAPVLLNWAIRTVDPKYLRYLHTTVGSDNTEEVQQILNSAVYVETYHLSIDCALSHDESPNLEEMQRLRTLRISVKLDWDDFLAAEREWWDRDLNPFDNALDTVVNLGQVPQEIYRTTHPQASRSQLTVSECPG
ncbi:hypothetical protein B0H16DRAFT_1861840 [Mycena metata]|uniref:Uncharacterized protein n=1 Tax=Mycena metata TaxID=1033252 RepID=A0AAD7IHE9_9AGAR|nr:hypothetical protein B0H16DRAFT_1861840 [Mycena metata]